MKSIFTFILLFSFIHLLAQDDLIIESIDESTFSFMSVDSPLNQIAGAPEPFFTYWWEFGDGHYSTKPNPQHTYISKQSHDVLLALTNNYDDGPSRPTKKKKVVSNQQLSASLVPSIDYLERNEALSIIKNHDPKPNEEIIFAQTYKNVSAENQKGTILFFYNQKEFEKDHFILADYRNHYNEKEIVLTKNIMFEKLDAIEFEELNSSDIFNKDYYATMLASSNNEMEASAAMLAGNELTEKKYFNNIKSIKNEIAQGFETYRDVIAFDFDDLSPETERNLFMSFLTTNDMLKDTNVTINVQSVFIPENYTYSTSVKHMMPIVTAHDPNKLIVNKSKTFRSFAKKNALEYEIKFQNVGKGPAEEVKLRFYNNADIDIKSINILEFEPKCDICSDNCSGSYIDTTVTKDYVEFYFHNIYLPGTRQSDIESRDASKGFVKFTLQTEKKVKQNNLTCRTEIYFDKEEPIKTNNSKTKFQKRLYFGLEAGTSYLPISLPKADIFLRGTMTLRLTNNWYYRTEIGSTYKPNTVDITSSADTTYSRQRGFFDVLDSAQNVINTVDYDINYIDAISNSETIIRTQSVYLDFVPIEFRRDINGAISLGFGINTKLHLMSSTSIENNINGNAFSLESIRLDSVYGGQTTQGQSIYYYMVDTKYNSSTFDMSSKEKSTQYNLDVVSGLFLDVNIGKIYSLPYFGVRAHVDYHFSLKKINPSLQFYLGANF